MLGHYRAFQIAIAELEAASGYDFGALNDADRLKKAEAGREAINVPNEGTANSCCKRDPMVHIARMRTKIQPARCWNSDRDAAPALLVA